MKKLLIHLVGAITLGGAAWPALAGPDFQIIESARMAKQTAVMAQRADVDKVGSTASQPLKCPPGALVLPLDHGPRPQTTPGENRLREARYEAQVEACVALRK